MNNIIIYIKMSIKRIIITNGDAVVVLSSGQT